MKNIKSLGFSAGVELVFAELLEASGIGVWAYEARTGLVCWNAWMSRRLGLAANAGPGKGAGWLDLIHPDEAPGARTRLEAALGRDGPEIDLPCRFRHSDGQWLWIRVLGRVVERDAAGEPRRLLGTLSDLSERQALERRLAETEERLRLVTDSITDVFWLADVGHETIDYVSPAYERIWRRPVAWLEANPGSFLESIHPDDLDAFRANLARLGEGLSLDHEYRILRPDCSVRWIRGRAFPVFDPDGAVRGCIGLACDISERTQAEGEIRRLNEALVEGIAKRTAELTELARELSDREVDFNRAQAVARIGSWRLNARDKRMTLSEETRRLFGIPQDKPMTYETFLAAVHPEDRDMVNRRWEAGLRGEPYGIEHRLIVDGRVIWVREHAELEFDGDGKLLGALGTTQDISERKRAELALRESEERLRLFIDHAPAALAMFDRDMRYLAVSRRWLLDYGLADTDIIGRSHYAIFPEIPERWKAVHRRGLAGEVVQADEDRFERSDGRVQWLHWSVRPWQGSDGRVGGIVVFTEDISERKQAEETLSRANRHNRALLEASLDPLIVIDPAGRISDLNRATETATGRSREQLLGTEFAVYFSDPDQARAGYRAAFEQGEVRDYALDLVHRDGWATPVLYNASVYRDSEGAVEQVFAAARDVTALKRITDMLQGRLRLLDMVEDRSLEEILRASIDEAVALTGSLVGFYHFLEPDQETLRLQTWSTRTMKEFCLAEGAGLHYPLSKAGVWADCVRQGRAVIHNDYTSIAHRHGLPEGHAEVIRELVVPVFRNKRIVGILGVGNKPRDYVEDDVSIVSNFADLAWDLVERKRDQEALRASEARYRRIVETTSEGIWTMDGEHRTTFVNTRMTALLGYERSEMLGRPVEDFMFPEDLDDHRERMRVRRSGGNEQYERRFRRRDGSELWTLVSADPVHGEENGFGGSFAMLTDISLIKEQQRRLERMAHYDALTGLPNRVLLADRLRMAMAHARREDRLLAVCYLDLDGFKPVNDTHGHAAGDRLLVEIAKRLTRDLRGEDTAARLGGDEFVLLLGDLASQAQGQGLLERLLVSIAEPYAIAPGRTVAVTVSLGVTLYPLDQSDADTLLRHADLAMYEAKQAGRNGFRLFGPE
ncbi:PAS domain S-box protein [Thiocystis violacea]|uniref:PAS domain S-box protein n=1 Tax=Thiocystis violacea TaxID=13725 RepID=UPI0019062AA2|nr:PAS domain S-box protein [Thiocystis violacea]MBK1716368.1 hypothetical protein [Thiocystis violacea]